MATPSRTIQSVTNTELYNRWAKVYDTDGNILQSIDDLLLPSLLSQTLSLLSPTSTTTTPSPLTITELGTGTGRNTLKLLSLPSPPPIHQINCLDLSPSMLDIAKSRCSAANTKGIDMQFYEYDALNPDALVEEKVNGKAELVLSTLVLEHLPLSTFFSVIINLLKESGGYLILTNMHPHMGSLSRAGFLDPETGEKIQGTSYVYGIEETVNEARKWGFEVVGDMRERGIREEDLKGGVVGERGGKWIGVGVWFGGVFRFAGGKGGEEREGRGLK